MEWKAESYLSVLSRLILLSGDHRHRHFGSCPFRSRHDFMVRLQTVLAAPVVGAHILALVGIEMERGPALVI